MNKEEFLKRLEQLLSDISEEERADALAFYRSYFEDAGIGNEASILEELELTEYQSFLAELQSHYPVISAAGIYDTEDNFYTWSNVEESADYSYMKEYQILEYYMLENYKK